MCGTPAGYSCARAETQIQLQQTFPEAPFPQQIAMPIAHRLLVTLLLTSSVLVFAQQPSKWVKVHRQNAGTLDQIGLTTADSTEGNFTVKLPCQFKDFTVDTPEQEAPSAKSFVVGCTRQDNRRFIATRVIYKAGGNGARERFELMVNSPRTAEILSKQETTFDGYRALDVEARNQASCGFTRTMLAEQTVVLMVVEALPGQCDKLATDAKTFFSSLRVHPLGQ